MSQIIWLLLFQINLSPLFTAIMSLKGPQEASGPLDQSLSRVFESHTAQVNDTKSPQTTKLGKKWHNINWQQRDTNDTSEMAASLVVVLSFSLGVLQGWGRDLCTGTLRSTHDVSWYFLVIYSVRLLQTTTRKYTVVESSVTHVL